MTSAASAPKRTIMTRLKEETADLHAAIEASPAMQALLSDQLTRIQYTAALMRMHGFLSPLTTQLAISGLEGTGAGEQLDLTHLADRLREDLATLGVPLMRRNMLPRCTALPPMESPEDAAGIAYVILGSTLGGNIIHKRLMDNCGAEVADATRFFAGHGGGKENGRKWMVFMAHMNARYPDPDSPEADRVVAAARETFQLYTDWLNAPARAATPAQRREPVTPR